MKKINKKIIFIFIIILIIFLSYKFYNYFNPKTEEEVLSCEDYFDNFIKKYKIIKIKQIEGSLENNNFIYSELYSSWLKFKEASILEQCQIFSHSARLDKKIYIITELLRQAEETVLEKRPEEAQDFFNQVTTELLLIKKENNITNIDDIILEIYPYIKKIRQSKNKEQAAASLEELKYRYVQLKEYSIDDEYQTLLKKIENEIRNLDRLLMGPDYIKSKEKLQEYVLEIYYSY